MPHAQYANWTDWESWEPSPDMEQSYPRLEVVMIWMAEWVSTAVNTGPPDRHL